MTTIANINDLLSDVRSLIAYNWESEARDFEQCEQEGNSQEGHIFLVLQRLDAFVDPSESEQFYAIQVFRGDGTDITNELSRHPSIDADRTPGQAVGSLASLTAGEARVALSQIIDNGREWGPTDDEAERLYKLSAAIINQERPLPATFETPDGWIVTVSQAD